MKRLTLLALVLAAGAVSAAPKADAEKGKQVATTICAACHAADGNSGIATYPKLAGQAAAYTYGQTMAIKDGTRTHGAAHAPGARGRLHRKTNKRHLRKRQRPYYHGG